MHTNWHHVMFQLVIIKFIEIFYIEKLSCTKVVRIEVNMDAQIFSVIPEGAVHIVKK